MTERILLRSPAFGEGGLIPREYTREGRDTSPALGWFDVPEGTAELVLVCEDRDAPAGTFLHWLVTGIDPAADGLPAGGRVRGAAEHRNGYGDVGWGGPLPPPGDRPHRYVFQLYALPEPLDLPSGAAPGEVLGRVRGRCIGKGTLTGRYGRRAAGR